MQLSTRVNAWLPVRNKRIEIDRDRLSYTRGYPTSLGPEHPPLQLSVWSDKEIAEAYLEAAIVSDSVSHLVVDVPGEKCHYETLTADYSYVTEDHKDHELHHVIYVWHLVRESDGKILYDSLDDASESWRTVGSSNAPLDWGEIVRRLRDAGELPHVPYRSAWSWP